MSGLIDKESFRKRFFELDVEFRPSQIDAIFDCLNSSELVCTVPVNQCKDCKYWDGYYCHHKGYGDGYGNYAPPIKSEEGFCDLAERKEE